MAHADGKASKGNGGSLRWSLPVAMMFPIFVAYVSRLNISFAINSIGLDYGWTLKEIGRNGGFLMSIFYVAYGLACISLSPLAERLGPRKSLVISVVVFSALTALCAPLGMFFAALVLLRVLNGIGQGIIYPMMNVLTKNWFPLHERSRANGIWGAAAFLPMVILPFILIPMIASWGWRAMFLITGGAGCVIALIPIIFYIRNSPGEHAKISPSELSSINDGMEIEDGDADSMKVGMKKLLKVKTYRLMIIAGILSDSLDFGLMSWFPIYLAKGRGLEASGLSFGTSVPYVFSIIGIMIWGYIGDKTNKRAVMTTAGFFGAGIALALAAMSRSAGMAVAFLALTVFIKSSWSPHEFSFLQYIVPKSQTGAGIGFYTGVAVIFGGALGPGIIGGALALTGSFAAALFSLVALAFLGGAVMYIVSRNLKY